ncbi:PadR family transcriptional regulator [Listeria cossartiae subsp. cayugensis]|uniref:PadR family transcriptional regulator n=1 Tax=Listeria cossartiae subsp. cayugensis TaxID=2713505 RepID=A0ABU2IM92_9LIST|nr:PadR family transcriptional regulator [Listeria cossartiae]MDT0049310.1 PadR family transcriptional regulator [Listeria cossartiae subsp. cayugensis]MDT0065813.1 PadR family transcriptional regulator [Listeria cossartiae subsp. cayugensis]MDT0078583.1 PadR family transcriptional regulator [Listeria cossartiae subsp. cayugensis]MDT0081419.1 PadR family transcriptional regulator [Listeria cossartiae subsp. cayugensis]MDT0088046.1 PadR family transcriptional regulator [Listeria cossartiae subs
MNDPFYNLKDSIKKDFEGFSFSEERKNAVKETIRKKQSHLELHYWKEETLRNILDSLHDEAKHGYEISTQLFKKNELSFKNNEGQLYILLHLLENKKIITSKWIENRKYYSLTTKGKKYVASYEHQGSKQQVSLKHLIEEVSL